MADDRAAFELMLVHNLKTPLTGILASIEMLEEGDHGALNAAQQSALSDMRTQGAAMVRMIDELLELGRTKSPSFSVQLVPLDPSAFLQELRGAWVGRVGRLTTTTADDVPDILADPEVLRRVFDNLVMNARVHAGPDAAVTIHAERAGDSVRITMADDGPGVPPADAERVFEPFVTLGRTGEHRTHGLGLAYCRAALAAMDGTITLVPTASGATFRVELPSAVVLTRQALEQSQ